MAAVALTYNLDQADRIHLGGNAWLVSGTVTTDTGDYAAGGFALNATNLGVDSIDRVIVGKSTLATVHAYWVKSTQKVFVLEDDAISGIPAEHATGAMDAQTIPFIAVVRKAA